MKKMTDLKVHAVSCLFPVEKAEPAYSFVVNDVLGLRKVGVETYVTTSCYGEDVNLNGIHIHRIQKSKFELSLCISRLCGFRESLFFPDSIYLWPLTAYSISKYRNEIIAETKKHRIDLIHAHFAYPEGYAAMLAVKAVKNPFVVSLQGHDILRDPSIDYGTRLKKHLDNCIKEVLATVDKVLVASTAVFREALEIGVSKDTLVLVPNGVDTHRFHPNLDGHAVRKRLGIKDYPIILFVGGLIQRKGIEYLLEAAKSVLSKLENARFIIVGEGPRRGYLEQLSKKLGISPNVVFAGRVSFAELPLFYAACDVFVLPSIAEAFGIVVIEAMSTGKPVIGSRVGGIPDMIEDGVNGYLVPSKKPSEIADRVIELLGDPKKAEMMGRQGRRLVKERFAIDKRVDQIMEVYEYVS